MAIKSTLLGPGSLVITPPGGRGRELAAQLTEFTLEPSVDAGDTIVTLSHDELIDEATVTWQVKGTALQDYDDDSLLLWAQEHHGKQCPFEFVPTRGAKLKVTGDIQVSVLGVGGTPKKRNTIDLEWKCANVKYAKTE